MALLNKTAKESGEEKAPKPPRKPKAPRVPKEPRLERKKAEAQAAPQWKSAYKPGVVLLPTKERSARLMRKSLRNASMVSGGMVLASAIGFISVSMSLSGAQSSLATHNELRAQNEAQLTASLPVTDYVSGIDMRKQAAVAALQGDTAFSKVISEIEAVNTFGARITAISIGEQSEPLTGTPFKDAGAVGYLQIGGFIENDSATEGIRLAGAYADALSNRGGLLTDAYATAAMQEERNQVRFSITVGYTEESYTFRGLVFRDSDGTDEERPAATGETEEEQGQ